MLTVELERFAANVERVLREKPHIRRAMFEAIAAIAKGEVDSNIGSMLNDSGGKIRSWQESKVGEKGGYARVKPVRGGSGRDSPGAVTNYLHSGHKQHPGQFVKRIGVRLKRSYVPGRPFYSAAAASVVPKADAMAQEFVELIASMLEG